MRLLLPILLPALPCIILNIKGRRGLLEWLQKLTGTMLQHLQTMVMADLPETKTLLIISVD